MGRVGRRSPPRPGALPGPNPALPPALRRFQPRGTPRPADPVAPAAEALAILFPPDGAEVELAGGKQALVPFVFDIVPDVDLEAGTCTITPPDGLLDI